MQERSNMKVAGGLQEDGIVIGNTYDKYGSRNPVVRYLMKGYEESLNEMVDFVKPESIHEVGCGEGYWSLKWLEKGIATRSRQGNGRSGSQSVRSAGKNPILGVHRQTHGHHRPRCRNGAGFDGAYLGRGHRTRWAHS